MGSRAASGDARGPLVSTFNPKPYKIVDYNPLIIGSNPQNGRVLDSRVVFQCGHCLHGL